MSLSGRTPRRKLPNTERRAVLAVHPGQVKLLARIAIIYNVPEEMATLLKHCAAFLDSTQEYVVTETLRIAHLILDSCHHRSHGEWLTRGFCQARRSARSSRRRGRREQRRHLPISPGAGEDISEGEPLIDW